MRRMALLAVLALAAAVAGGVGATAADAPVRVTGTVTYSNGTPAAGAYVLLGDVGLLEKSSPDRLYRIARGDPADVTVTRTDADGEYAATAPSAAAVVAVTERGTSEVRRFDGNATIDLTLGRGKPLAFVATNGTVAPGNTTRLSVALRNDGDRRVTGLRLSVGDFPAGWSVTEHATNGTYHPGNRTVTWSSVAPDTWAEVSVTVRIPADADHGEYTIPLRAGSETHRIEAPALAVEIRPPETPGETLTALPAGDQATPVGTPGFGVVAGAVALALVALAARHTD